MMNPSQKLLVTALAAGVCAAASSSYAGVVTFDPNNSTVTGGTTSQTLSQTDAGDTGLTVELDLTAVGGTNSTFDVSASGIGVLGGDLGDRFQDDESILMSFDQLVDLLSIEFGAFNGGTNSNDTVRLAYVSGTNPFASITIDTNDDTANLALIETGGVGTGFDAINITNTLGTNGVANLVSFNVGTNDLINIAAGTVLELSSVNATEGVQLRDITVDVQVPEPGSLALMGLGGLCIMRRRRSA